MRLRIKIKNRGDSLFNNVCCPILKMKQGITLSLITAFALLCSMPALAAGYEKAPVFSAKSILKADEIKGKHFIVEDKVKNDGLFNHYTVKSDFGTFKAASTRDLKILLHEIGAIAAMKEVATDETAMAGLKQSGENAVTGLKNLVDDPQATLEGAVSGVGSLFNRARNTIGQRQATGAEDSKLEQLVGISKSKGIIANKFQVNVYSRNKVLQGELDRLGRADFAGGLGVGVASSFVPGIGGLGLTTSGTARLLNEAINNTPASELWLQNKNKLTGLGMNEDTVKLYLNNPSFSPAMATVMTAALESMKGVDNLELFLKVSLQASDPDMARIMTRISVMTAGYHTRISPLKRITPLARVTMAERKDGTPVVLLPADYMTWSARVADAVASIGGNDKGKGGELWLPGTVSTTADAELKKMGWKIHTNSAKKLLPDGK
jgi:hypothetical protein